MTDEQIEKASPPTPHPDFLAVQAWLADNCHPHCIVIVDSERAELVEGLAVVRREPVQKEVLK